MTYWLSMNLSGDEITGDVLILMNLPDMINDWLLQQAFKACFPKYD